VSKPVKAEFGAEQPVEDVLEQHREDDPLEDDTQPDGQAPTEADEADYVEQQRAVPLEEDRRAVPSEDDH
jgi:hypothetical protein